jgi:putative DNA primase/helicase
MNRGRTDDKIEADIERHPDKWAKTSASDYIDEGRLRRVGKEGEPRYKKGEIERIREDWEAKGGKVNADDDLITEDSTALVFADDHADDLRFDHNAAAWFEWNGALWKHDGTRKAFSWARQLARKFAKDQPTEKLKYLTSKMAFAAAVERGAQSDQRIAVTQAAWDTDHYLLGTPGGTVDLRTGKLRDADPDEMITKATSVAPKRMKTPVWDKFLGEVTDDDDDLIRFLQSVCGYALTGATTEDLLVFVYGPGGNGKTTFLNTIAGVFGDYATAAAMDTFTATRNDRHPADMAMLRGARLVTCAETTEGRAWDETRIKQFTGGDPITARFMRQNFFTYMPTFQMIVIGNYQPRLINITQAMRRRLVVVPFNFKPRVADIELEEKLKAEWPGILQWMLIGCLRWQRKKGIVRPDAVQVLTDEYFREQDLLGQWIEHCVKRTNKQRDMVLRSDAFRSWTFFAERAKEDPMTSKWFCNAMRDRGFAEKTTNHGRYFTHVEVIGAKWG